ncbi:hypothetical protein N0B31_01080 [Salinirubellus salinus]|jgi:DNA-binding response OmpR family regulator|uniref:Response regulatory domain-containing protein n=1 Tax=Salinirubellus salinus TaxID=1364945 RepID=A0A9E7U4Z7_9EURY|nr:hypothetical protein [Salinirubellus salinus]UWM54885.1 hypothetical protein N0B31_01080 [Salinirubellus salinus]
MQANGVDEPTVLVVDDGPGVADTSARRLEDEYRVGVTYSGEDALDYLRAFPVDVVVLERRAADYRASDDGVVGSSAAHE